jgi:short-subunit dehydrogenase
MPTALVTGASAGLGAAFARHLAAEGNDLVIVARDEMRLETTRVALEEHYSVAVDVLPADLSTPNGRVIVARRIADPSAPIELLVNNAGSGLYRAFGQTPLADEQRMLQLNVGAVMELSHAAVAAMTARGSGIILNVASVAGFVARGATVTYGASKAYVVAFTEALALLLADTGVSATVVCPGFVHTEFHERADVDMGAIPDWMWLDADDVVATGLADARKGKTISIPDVRYKAIVGLSRVAGRRITRRISASGGPRARR